MNKKCLPIVASMVFWAVSLIAQPFTLQDFQQLYALRGAWTLTNKQGVLHEVWRLKSADYLMGTSFLVRGQDTIPQETIELRFRDGAITYTPVVVNQNDGLPVVFTLNKLEAGRCVFENPKHDFPQRIVYQIPKDTLLDAYIEGPTSGGWRKIPFQYHRISWRHRAPSAAYLARKEAASRAPSVFQKEIDGLFPERVVYQDSLVTALYPLGGQLPAHFLIIPNQVIPTLNDAKASDAALLGHMILTARDLARQEGFDETGYRLAFNTNEDAGQSAFHLHLHLMGGARTGAMVDQRWRSIRRRLSDNTLSEPFEKRILGIWSGNDTISGMPANISMSWEPDLQNHFILLNYRTELRDSSGRMKVFEGKAFYRNADDAPGHYIATWFDTDGGMYPVDANYDGRMLSAIWKKSATESEKTEYHFLDDNTLEIKNFSQRKAGKWKLDHQLKVVKNKL